MLGDHVEIGGTLKACRRSIEFLSPVLLYIIWSGGIGKHTWLCLGIKDPSTLGARD